MSIPLPPAQITVEHEILTPVVDGSGALTGETIIKRTTTKIEQIRFQALYDDKNNVIKAKNYNNGQIGNFTTDNTNLDNKEDVIDGYIDGIIASYVPSAE